MSAHQKRFLMMHNNSVKKIQRESGALTITPPQRNNVLGRNKVYIYINQLYFITIIGIHFAKELNKIYLSK